MAGVACRFPEQWAARAQWVSRGESESLHLHGLATRPNAQAPGGAHGCLDFSYRYPKLGLRQLSPIDLQRSQIKGIGPLVGLMLVARNPLCFVHDQRICKVCCLIAVYSLYVFRHGKIIERRLYRLLVLKNRIRLFQKTHYYRLNIFLRRLVTLAF